MTQAPMTIHTYLWAAEESIDKVFGKGYAKANPILVASFIEASQRDFQNTTGLAAIYALGDQIEAVATAIRDSQPL